jgi:hypothetical protein
MPIMSLRAFARLNHVDRARVRQWIDAGMPALQQGRRWYIPSLEAEAWLAAQAQAQRAAESSPVQEVTHA